MLKVQGKQILMGFSDIIIISILQFICRPSSLEITGQFEKIPIY